MGIKVTAMTADRTVHQRMRIRIVVTTSKRHRAPC
jgi:hypothetical protein